MHILTYTIDNWRQCFSDAHFMRKNTITTNQKSVDFYYNQVSVKAHRKKGKHKMDPLTNEKSSRQLNKIWKLSNYLKQVCKANNGSTLVHINLSRFYSVSVL